MVASGPATPAPGELTGATRQPDVVEVPRRLVLALSGAGSPDSPDFAASIGALYGVAYALKFRRKNATGEDFKVGPLVGIWRVEGPTPVPGQVPPRDAWRWTVQLDVPLDVTSVDIRETVKFAVSKRGGKLEGNQHAARIELVDEPPRRFARILHVGPYADEPQSFDAIGAILDSQGLRREPWHIEVYLSDPGRVAPEKLKTVLLAPVVT
jgi:hypothetical protein